MTDNEKQLIKMIRESKNPEEALLMAVRIISSLLNQEQNAEEQAPSCHQELL